VQFCIPILKFGFAFVYELNFMMGIKKCTIWRWFWICWPIFYSHIEIWLCICLRIKFCAHQMVRTLHFSKKSKSLYPTVQCSVQFVVTCILVFKACYTKFYVLLPYIIYVMQSGRFL
jgi:hypothetical protein